MGDKSDPFAGVEEEVVFLDEDQDQKDGDVAVWVIFLQCNDGWLQYTASWDMLKSPRTSIKIKRDDSIS